MKHQIYQCVIVNIYNYLLHIDLVMYVDLPVFISKPHCFKCDPEYFKNVSGYHPDRKKHGTWSAIEPVSNLNTYIHIIIFSKSPLHYIARCTTHV